MNNCIICKKEIGNGLILCDSCLLGELAKRLQFANRNSQTSENITSNSEQTFDPFADVSSKASQNPYLDSYQTINQVSSFDPFGGFSSNTKGQTETATPNQLNNMSPQNEQQKFPPDEFDLMNNDNMDSSNGEFNPFD